MNSPPRGLAATGRIIQQYNRSYNDKPFVPLHSIVVNGYNCIRVEPADQSFFYRMNQREKPFAFEGETAADVFGTTKDGVPRHKYFGLQPSNIMDAYGMHSHLYVIKPRETIVLIDMGVLENVERLLATAPGAAAPVDYAASIRIAFPIVDGVVTRHSVPAINHNDKIDHDRRALEYICTLDGIDGYYVAVRGLHPEIAICSSSLEKLSVVNKFRVRADQDQPRRGKRFLTPNNNSPNNTRRARGRFSLENASSNSSSKSSGNRGLFGLLSFEGGKRKRRTQRKRRTHRK
jgi:hypothetical protein